MDRLEFHPPANIFPMMTDEEVNDLGDDMLKHGQRELIWKYEGTILDGRNRYNACLLKGIEPRIVEYRSLDPLGFVVSLNLHRRHLDDAQRAMIAAKLATMKRGDNQHSPNGETSQAKAAKLLNVSKRRVERTREVIDKGVPDLVDAVENGAVKVSAAAEFANKVPPLDQHRLIAEHGSPAAAVKATVKAKADRAAVKQPKPMPDVRAAADRAERVQQPRFGEFKNSKGEIKSACDLNPEDPDDVAEPGDSDEVIRHRIFLHHASEALRHARAIASLRQKAAPQEITDDIIKAASQAAKAWSELMQALDPVRFVVRLFDELVDELDDQERQEFWAACQQRWPGEFDVARARVRSSR
jgi:hypothetical protein